MVFPAENVANTMNGLMVLLDQSAVNGIGENTKFMLVPVAAKVIEAATKWSKFIVEKSRTKLGRNPLCPNGTSDLTVYKWLSRKNERGFTANDSHLKTGHILR